jgi:hypothetical protein
VRLASPTQARIITAMRALAPLLLLAATLAPGADIVINDVRADVGLQATDIASRRTLETTPSGGGATTTASVENRDNAVESRAGVQWLLGTLDTGGGIVYGAQFAARNYRFGHGPLRTRVRGPTIDALAGYAVAPLDYLHVEVTPFAGIGYDQLRIDGGGGAPSVDNQSVHLEYGGRVGLYTTIDRCWQVGLELPLVFGHSRPKYAYLDAGGNRVVATDSTTTRSVGAMLGLGVRF